MTIGVEAGTDWAAWTTAIATAVLAVGVIVALFAFWDTRKTRDGQLLMDFARQWTSDSVAESMKAYSTHGPPGIIQLLERLYPSHGTAVATEADLDLYHVIRRWPELIESLGVLHARGAIGTEVIYRLWGPGIYAAWEAWREPVAVVRELQGQPEIFQHFELLGRVMGAKRSKDERRRAKAKLKAVKKTVLRG